MFGFIFSLIFGHFGSRIGLKVLYCMGTVVSGTCGILFGCLAYIQDSRLFIGLSYILWCYEAKLLVVQISDSIFCRSIQGAAEAASDAAIVGIFLAIFPNWTASIASLTETSVGLGNTLGGKGNIKLEETWPRNIILFRPSTWIIPTHVGWLPPPILLCGLQYRHIVNFYNSHHAKHKY